jgi:hypothetical protein
MRVRRSQIPSLPYTMVTAVRSMPLVFGWCFSKHVILGGSVAKFAGSNVHKRLVSEESYREKRYEEALKRAFLGTDEDLLASQSQYSRCCRDLSISEPWFLTDTAHTRDPSGCTAVAALVTGDGKIYVVRDTLLDAWYIIGLIPLSGKCRRFKIGT